MEFANPENLLLPGMYVLAEIPQAKLSDAILAPQEGVTRDRRGRPVAYVVGSDDVVQERPLEIIQDRGNTWVIRKGLEAGDRLVVAGFQFIQPGMTVTPEEREAAPADASGGSGATPPAADDAPAPAADAAPSADAAPATADTASPAAGSEPSPAEPASGDSASPSDAPGNGN